MLDFGQLHQPTEMRWLTFREYQANYSIAMEHAAISKVLLLTIWILHACLARLLLKFGRDDILYRTQNCGIHIFPS